MKNSYYAATQILSLSLFLIWPGSIFAQNIITTFAGTDWIFPGNGKPALNAPFGALEGVTVDSLGRAVFADPGNHVVVRIEDSGSVTVLAGNGLARYSGDGGPAVNAALNQPTDVAFDAAGNLYITDLGNNRIRMVTPDGNIKTIAGNAKYGFNGDGGRAINALISSPARIAVDSALNIYFGDTGNNRVRRITPAGVISTVAGNGTAGFSGDGGPGFLAALDDVEGLAVDSADNLYISDYQNNRVRKIDSKGVISTVAGDGQKRFFGDQGPSVNASLYGPGGIFVDRGNNIYVADVNNYRIRKIDVRGVITTFAGTGTPGFSGDGGPALAAKFGVMFGLAGDSKGNVLATDRENHRIRQINSQGIVTTIAGNDRFRFFPDGTIASNAFFYQPSGVSLDSGGNIYIADTSNNRIRLISNSGAASTIAGNGSENYTGDGGPAIEASLASPVSVLPDNAGNLYVADSLNNCIRKISASGIITTIAGNGAAGYSGDGQSAVAASLNTPQQAVLDSAGNLYISDYNNNVIRKVTADGRISTYGGKGVASFSGDGGPATAATLNGPTGLAVFGGKLYVADTFNSRIRAINLADATISTVAGGGTATPDVKPVAATQVLLKSPVGLTADNQGNLFFSDAVTNNVLKLFSTGTVAIVAGNGVPGFSGDGGIATLASMAVPYGLAIDSAGNLLIADTGNDRIRVVLATPPAVQASPASLTFSATSAGNLSDYQTLSLNSTLSGLVYSAGFTARSGGDWLRINKPVGTLPASIQVSVDPTNLQPGDYQGTIQILASGALAASINVMVSVSSGAKPQLGTASSNVYFSFTKGAPGSSQALSVKNLGGGSLNFTASISPVTGGGWLGVSPAQGQATPVSPVPLVLEASPGALDAGTYQALLNIRSDSGDNVKIPITMTISAGSGMLILSQSSVKFTSVADGGSPPPQRFAIANSGQGTLSWTVQSSVLSGSDDGNAWLSVSPASGASAADSLDIPFIDVRVDSSGLSPGQYYGKIQVIAPGAANSPQLVSVILEVLALGSDPGPTVEPSGLVFIGESGASPGSQTLSIRNPSSRSTNFAVGKLTADGRNWLIHAPTNGVSAPSQPSQVVVQPDYSNLPPGTYNGTLTFGFGQGTVRTVDVLTVVAPAASTASNRPLLVEPQAGTCKPTSLSLQFQSLSADFVAIIGQPTTIALQITDNCGNRMSPTDQVKALVSATFSNGDSDLSLNYANGVWSTAWRPAHAASKVTLAINAFWFLPPPNSTLINNAALVGSVRTSTTPVVTAGGVVQAASFSPGAPLAPGSLVSIYGSNLADTSGVATDVPLPILLNGSQAELGATNLPLLYTSTGQLNVQVPFDIPSDTQYQIVVQRGATLSMPENLVIAQAQPGIFTINQQGSGQGIIFKSDQITYAQPGTPASPGETIVIYCTGLGAVSEDVKAGDPAPVGAMTVHTVTVSMGGVNAAVQFAGLSPDSVGLYQVNAKVPDGVTGDAVPVTLTVAGQTSPVVTMAVR
jgi:uncharacterized protein (TIGR03437 family)